MNYVVIPYRVAFERAIYSNISTLNLSYKSVLVRCFDWKNALSKFKVHGRSKLHRDSIYVVYQQGKLNVREQ